jgi:tRNA (cytidine/uridine-2'-O-)-methyltransferase
MDYLETANLTRHLSWDAFEKWREQNGKRLVLASTKAASPYTQFKFGLNDILLFGRESSGVPDHVHEKSDERIIIEMQPEMRSLNLAMSVAMITGEALRQIKLDI